MRSKQLSTRVQLSVIKTGGIHYISNVILGIMDTDFNFIVKNYVFVSPTKFLRGTRWWSWSRHCATSRKFVGLIADFHIAVFIYTSGPNTALESTQPLTQIGNRNISFRGTGGQGVRLIM